MATQDAIAKPRFWHTEVAYRETTMYIQRDYAGEATMYIERVYMQRDTTVYIQRHYYVHTESIQSVHLEELVCTYREMTMYIHRRLLYVHTIVERWIMYIQDRLWQCTLRSGVTDYATFFNPHYMT
jgi:hypothetical protein